MSVQQPGIKFTPHDHEKNPLQVGDVVVVPCVVTGVDRQPGYINVAMNTCWPMLPGNHATSIMLNTSQVILVRKTPKKLDSVHVMDVIEDIKKTGSTVIKGRDEVT
jgi:hypothetical protein